jgi:hypothetical protein
MPSDRASLIAALRRALAEVEAEFGEMPFFVRPMVKRGFVSRTGHDLDAWRRLLDEAGRNAEAPTLKGDLDKLIDNFLGAPERAKKGMGAGGDKLKELEAKAQARAGAARALRDAL